MDQKVKHFKKKEIAASLQYGKIFSNNLLAFFYFTIFISILSFIGIIYCGIEESDYYIYFGLLFPMSLIVASIVFVAKITISNKNVKIWLQDAILVKCKIIKIGEANEFNNLNEHKRIKVRVTFHLNGKRIVKESGEVNYFKHKYSEKAGYHRIFHQYVNKQVETLYSPTYDQILLLKLN